MINTSLSLASLAGSPRAYPGSFAGSLTLPTLGAMFSLVTRQALSWRLAAVSRQLVEPIPGALLCIAAATLVWADGGTDVGDSAPHMNMDRAVVGAIRWDGWNEWDVWQRCFDPPEWRNRLPFFASVTPEGKALVREDSQEVIDKEIAYAKAGGLDYWAFVWYHPNGWPPNSRNMAKCFQLYLSSALKMDINYSLIISGGLHLGPTERLPETMDYLVQRLKDPNYQKVLGGRPLVYFLEIADMVKDMGSEESARDWLKSLRHKAVAAGAGNPYFVVMAYWPPRGAEQLDALGGDAISAYTGHCIGQVVDNKGFAYAKLAEINRTFWENAKATGKAFIPTMNAGWDSRPMKRPEFPDRDRKDDWYAPPTPRELADHLKSAMDWVEANPSVCPARSVLIYAWNELSEGGWLVPTLSEGTARLDALSEVLKAESVPPGAAALSFTKCVIDESPTAAGIAPGPDGNYAWFSGQWWYSPKPPLSEYLTQDGVLALALGGDLVSAPNDFSTGKLRLLPGSDGFYVEFDCWLSDNDPDHFPALWLMPAEHNGKREDHYAWDPPGHERWMEFDIDEGSWGPGLAGTVHSHSGIYEEGYQQIRNPNNVSSVPIDRSKKHTFGGSYDPVHQSVTWWVDGVEQMSAGAPYVPAVAANQHFYLIVSAQSRGAQKPYSMFVSGVRAYVPPTSALPPAR